MRDKAYWNAYYSAHKEQRRKEQRTRYAAHPERGKSASKRYRKEHPDKARATTKKWTDEHREQVRKKAKEWLDNHPGFEQRYRQTESGKERKRKIEFKRRQFGFYPLNNSFPGSEGHHIDMIRVIYIPKKMHRSVWHSILQNVNMGKINKLAVDFLLKGVNNDISVR